jgi:ParB/RepB/Spo0J family partition protein
MPKVKKSASVSIVTNNVQEDTALKSATITVNGQTKSIIAQEDTATIPANKTPKTPKANKSTVTVQETVTTTQEDTATMPKVKTPKASKSTVTTTPESNGILQSLDAFLVDPNKVQTIAGINPRKNLDLQDLKDYIKVNGTANLPPIKVYADTVNGAFTLYLTEGHRRLQAARELIADGFAINGLPAMYADKDTARDKLLFANLTSNQGKSLEAMEIAECIACLIKEHKWTQADIASKMGKTAPWVTQKLSLLQATPEVVEAVEKGLISATTAQSIVATGKKYGNNSTTQETKVQNDALAQQIIKNGNKAPKQGTGTQGSTRGRPKGSASTANTGTSKSQASTSKPASTNNVPASTSNVPATPNNAPTNKGTVSSTPRSDTPVSLGTDFSKEKDPAVKALLMSANTNVVRARASVGLQNVLLMLINFEKSKDGTLDYVADLKVCYDKIAKLNK